MANAYNNGYYPPYSNVYSPYQPHLYNHYEPIDVSGSSGVNMSTNQHFPSSIHRISRPATVRAVWQVIRCLLIVPFPESALNEEAKPLIYRCVGWRIQVVKGQQWLIVINNGG